MNLPRISDEDRRCLSKQKSVEWIALKREVPSEPDNTPSSISRLPNEILVEIFRYTQQTCEKNEWLVFTWVSQHWRTVALGYIGFWTSIKCYGHVAFLVAYLQRSGDLNVTVDILRPLRYGYGSAGRTEDMQNLVEKTFNAYGDRIRVLNLDWKMELDSFSAFLFTRSGTFLCNLEVLRVHNQSPFSRNSGLAVSRHGLVYPHLLTLHLTSVYILYHPDSFTGLRHLYLHKVYLARPTTNVDADIDEALVLLLEMLRGCSRLESFELLGADPIYWPSPLNPTFADPDPERKVSLPRLQCLKLYVTELCTVNLLSHMILPSLVKVRLKFRSEVNFFQYFDSNIEPSSLLPSRFRSLNLACAASCPTDVEPPLEALDSAAEDFVLHVIDSLFVDYLRSVPNLLPSLTRLNVGGDLFSVDTPRWREILEGLPGLVSIRVQDIRTARWLVSNRHEMIGDNSSLHSLSAALAADPSAPMVCPKLEELSIVIVVSNHQRAPTLKGLLSALNDRKLHNMPLKKLALTEAGNDEFVEDDTLSEFIVHDVNKLRRLGE